MAKQPSIRIQRSSALNTINGVGGVLRKVRIDPFKLKADSIIAKAKKKANYKGDLPKAEEGLRELVRSINEESNPNTFGALAVKSLFERSLYGRYKIEQELANNPQIEQEEIKQPVFIIGMPRTGTTILHALMHEDPAHRSPLAWECLLPYPATTPETFRNNDQLKTVSKEFGQLFKLVPDFLKKHYMAADSPQECLGITALNFTSFQPTAQLYVPGYMDWFFHQSDMLDNMKFHKRFLQYLQSGGVKAERWLLKSPVHLMRLPEIFEVYPDAKIIMTHREPEFVVSSTASLISSVRSLYSDTEDPFRTGREQADLWSLYFKKFLDNRKSLNKEEQIIDLQFEDFVKDQVGTVRKIYDRFNWPLSDETVKKFESFLEQNPKDKNGKHIYSLETFGLNKKDINHQYRDYLTFLEELKQTIMAYKSKEALNQFLEVIKNTDLTFLDPDKVIDEQGKVDGYQHIFHLLRTSIDFYLFNDPLNPNFMLLANPYHKVVGDNVDAVYYFTQVRSDQEYIINGKRYDSVYLSFCLYGGEPNGELAETVTQNINHTNIEFEEDGSFEIKLTPNPKGKNEFKLDKDAVTLFTREYFFDRFNSRESDLSIRNTKPVEISKPLSDEVLAQRIKVMSTFFEQTTWVAPLPVEFPLNDFLPPFQFKADQGGWGTVDNIYCFGRFRLEENQYLKIRFTSPECCYWGIQTWNFLMQSMDYKNYNVCINKGTAKVNDDGSYTVYLSHRKMDVDNWISTAAYKEAIIFCRWLLAEELPEQPTVELCEFSD